jgi:cation transport ATPase
MHRWRRSHVQTQLAEKQPLDFAFAIERAVTVVVITCPHALAPATAL